MTIELLSEIVGNKVPYANIVRIQSQWRGRQARKLYMEMLKNKSKAHQLWDYMNTADGTKGTKKKEDKLTNAQQKIMSMGRYLDKN